MEVRPSRSRETNGKTPNPTVKCEGDHERNVAMTFGGHWHEGPRSDLRSWVDTPGLGNFSLDPRRVPFTMWEHISTRGECVEPAPGSVPDQTCEADGDCNDGDACTVDTCHAASGTCANVPTESECCGNNGEFPPALSLVCKRKPHPPKFANCNPVCAQSPLRTVCEPGERDCGDCGPFESPLLLCDECEVSPGIMFNVQILDGVNVSLGGVDLYLYQFPNDEDRIPRDVTVFTAAGTYS